MNNSERELRAKNLLENELFNEAFEVLKKRITKSVGTEWFPKLRSERIYLVSRKAARKDTRPYNVNRGNGTHG